jgi:hypothetical protein
MVQSSCSNKIAGGRKNKIKRAGRSCSQPGIINDKKWVLFPLIVLPYPAKKGVLLPLTEFQGVRSGLKPSYEFNYTNKHHFKKKVYRIAAEGNRGSSH